MSESLVDQAVQYCWQYPDSRIFLPIGLADPCNLHRLLPIAMAIKCLSRPSHLPVPADSNLKILIPILLSAKRVLRCRVPAFIQVVNRVYVMR